MINSEQFTTDETHRDGIPWHRAPIPWRWHRCKAWTGGLIGKTTIERCACGGWRMGDLNMWIQRNARRHELKTKARYRLSGSM